MNPMWFWEGVDLNWFMAKNGGCVGSEVILDDCVEGWFCAEEEWSGGIDL
jgi:hypothetical protein